MQADLAEAYGVGVTPVREALRRLALEGFLFSVPRLGYQVSQVTYQDVQEIFEMRLILECASGRLAAVRASDEALRSIADSANFTYVFKERDSYMVFLSHNAAFHISIAEAAGNQRLVSQIRKVLDELHRVFHLGLDLKDSAATMRDDHLGLSAALLSRDADRIEQLIREDIKNSRDRVLEASSRLNSKQNQPLGYFNEV